MNLTVGSEMEFQHMLDYIKVAFWMSWQSSRIHGMILCGQAFALPFLCVIKTIHAIILRYFSESLLYISSLLIMLILCSVKFDIFYIH